MVATVRWASDELEHALALLTAQQASGVIRIVQAELAGESLSSLLDCPGQICTSTTYYGSGKRKGWKDRDEFTTAIELARRDYRSWLLEHGTGDALLVLAQTAPDAARALRQQVIGDSATIDVLIELLDSDKPSERAMAAQWMGNAGQPRVTVHLFQALLDEDNDDTRRAIISAIGNIAGFRDSDRARAAIGVLDRAAIETAAKRALSIGEDDIDAAIKRELEALANFSKAGDAEEAARETFNAGSDAASE